jgi:S-methylmethionine-dependent homocysteine/selenocysteine methylase
MRRRFPRQQDGVFYLTEGGQETEIMYRHGFDLPHFAMFTLLDNPTAIEKMTEMYRAYLDVAVRHDFIPLMGGVDYRASSDWGALLGLSPDDLAEMQMRAVGFLRDVSASYRDRLPDILIVGTVGPRGDAYELNRTITADEAEAYHSAQMTVLARAEVDLVTAMTFNTVEEAVGVARAAAKANLPLCISFMLDADARLKSGDSLREAIETVDARSADDRPDFYGINCSHPIEFEPALEDGAWIHRLRSLRPNASAKDKIELCQIGHLETGDPPDLADRMAKLAMHYPHIDIWGGCCGTWDVHLDDIASRIRGIAQGPGTPTTGSM